MPQIPSTQTTLKPIPKRFIGFRQNGVAFLALSGIVFLFPAFAQPAASLWQAVPLITQSSLTAGNAGGEGCQVIQNITVDSTGNFLLMGTEIGRASCRER